MSARSVGFLHRSLLDSRPNDSSRTRKRIACAAAASLLAIFVATPLVHAGAIWTDANGDGLPDAPGTLVASAGEVLSVDLWVDSQSFAWTNFLAYAEWTPGCFTFVSGQYIIAGGQNFPVDWFSHPHGVGFGGFTYSHQGVEAIATINLRATTAGVCCVTPIIDTDNPYYVFSQLGAPDGAYFLFTSNPNSCWDIGATPQACCFTNGSCAILLPVDCTASGGTPQGQGTTCGTVSCPPPEPRGACCAPSGSCANSVRAPECVASGGVYQGDNTDCSSVNCPAPTGACCYPDGTCANAVPEADCVAGSGVYQGDGVGCASVNCPLTIGACCYPNGECAHIFPAADCAATGGVYQGDGVYCESAPCPPPVRACCFADATCQLLTEAACAAAGGVYRADSESCAAANCEGLGACCFASGACSSPVTAVQCAAAGGAYQGDGSDCAGVDCAGPVGACCYPSGACVNPISAAECASGGGTYQGDDTICPDVSCPQPVGACCFADASCELLTSAACTAQGGAYQGGGTSCALVDCSPPEGACCLADGSCDLQTSVACAANGGEYQGDGTPCSAVNCAIAGACCLPATGCADNYTAEQCGAAGGVYLGDGETCAASVCGGTRIWTDANADGLPDVGPPLAATQGDIVSLDLWIDSQGFQWTNYLAYVEWPAGCMTYTSAQYFITGGSNFPIDDFSHPSGVGFGGSGFDEIGIDRIGRVNVRLDAPIACCVTPIIDIYNPFYVFSQLGSPSGYRLFNTLSGSCWQAAPLPGAGACCHPDGSCDLRTEIACTSAGGVFQGDGTYCATTVCPAPAPTGACCFPSGTCAGAITETTCIAVGGAYQGDGTTCSGVDCTPPTGACCYADGSCAILTGAACLEGGGEFRGDGVSCATANCAGLGACCVPNIGCAPNNTAEQCAAAGGIFLGEGSVCGPDACTGTRIWTDANGDGLPDSGPPAGGIVGDVVSMDLWIDSQGFAWTNYLAYVEWPAGCMSYESAEYLISGGSNFPIDDFSHPSGIGFGGTGYDEIGIDRIGRVRVRLGSPVACCVTPIIDAGNPFYVFSQLRAGAGFRLFDNLSGSCWQITPPPPTGACCFYSPQSCQERTEAQCAASGGTYLGDGTSCATDSCPPPPPPTGACCIDGECVGEMTLSDCESVGGTYRGDATRCTTPNICLPPSPCPPPTPGASGAIAMEESAGATARRASKLTPCSLPTSTNGTAANYRWYNVCSGYIWIYNNLQAGEGVGVLFGGWSQPAVNGDNDVKRVITYFRNVCPNYNQTVDVFVDVDFEGDGCPNANLGSDLNIDPALRWNCSDFGASVPCDVTRLLVRAVHDGGTSPSFATDGPFTATCDPNAPGRSYYYGVGGSACIPWRGPDGTYDNFLFWLILDYSSPCVTAVEPTTWGRIKGMFR